MSDLNPYRIQWDAYAKAWHPKIVKERPLGEDNWPGDEWLNEQAWLKLFDALFLESGAKQWRECVEIGPGSGKYTNYILRHTQAHVIAFDISPHYQEVMKCRLATDIAEGRLEPALIKAENASEILENLRDRALVRKLDCFFSIDAMVHVDLQYLAAYFLTAALSLRRDGLLIMTLANCVSRDGFAHLLRGLKTYYPLQGRPTAKFEYLSPQIASHVLEAMGFEVTFISPFGRGLDIDRDLYVVARLTDLERAESLRDFMY